MNAATPVRPRPAGLMPTLLLALRQIGALALLAVGCWGLPLAQAKAPGSPPEHGAEVPRPALTPSELRQQLASMPRGDAGRGAQLYRQQFCASCHGQQGLSPTLNWPHVAGQRPAYAYKLLLDYQQGRHPVGHRTALMRDAVQGLSPQALADLAVHMAGQPAPRAASPAQPADAVAWRLVRDGDPSRLLTACASCHGARGEGSVKAQPALAGQNVSHLVRSLLDYHGGQRANDPAKGMRVFAQRLSREEIDALARYYAALGAQP